MRFEPHPYQLKAIEHALNNPGAGLFLKPGLGKTVVTLTVLEELIHDRFEISKALIIAPKRVCEDVWPEELSKWDHLSLSYSLIAGPPQRRLEALERRADLYIISRDNVAWLATLCDLRHSWPFECVVIDELSSFKAWDAKRFKALKKFRPYIHRVIGLTGTPRPNSDLDLWAQLYLLDGGARLGTTITSYKRLYFYQPSAYMPYKWAPKPGASEKIQKAIGDICLTMRAEDYLNLPEVRYQARSVSLSPKLLNGYKDFEREMVLSVDDETITATSRAIVINKLLQYASGAIYDEERRVHYIHEAKLEALQELIEEAGGRPVLVFYNFRHDLSRIKEALMEYEPRELQSSADIEDWNAGKVKVLLAHPASCGYGLNLQAGGHLIVWFSLTWSQEQYEQANARLHRQGQSEPVIVHHLIVRGTADELVLAALERKKCGQEELFKALKARI